MKSTNNTRGFTLVELLIVIVVIAILAAITLVAYNGIQKRANTAAMKSDMSNMSRVISANYIENSNSLPTTENSSDQLTKIKTELGGIAQKSTWSSQYFNPIDSPTSTPQGNYFIYAYEYQSAGSFMVYFYDYGDGYWKLKDYRWDGDRISIVESDGQLQQPGESGPCSTKNIEDCSYLPQ